MLGVKVNKRPLLAVPATGTTIDVGVQIVGVAAVPLNVTVSVVVPKFFPEIVTGVPTSPWFGVRLARAGASAALTASKAMTMPAPESRSVPAPIMSIALLVRNPATSLFVRVLSTDLTSAAIAAACGAAADVP